MGLKINRRSIKYSERKEAPKRQGAEKKFGNINESVPEGTNIQMARGSVKVDEIKHGSIIEF
jgi:hypothetical protein